MEFLQLGRGDRPPVPPGVHPVASLSNNYQLLDLLQHCEGPEAPKLLKLIKEGKTREFTAQLKGASFTVTAAGTWRSRSIAWPPRPCTTGSR